MKISPKVLTIVGSLLLTIIVLGNTMGINDNGYRTVVQLPNGTTFVKFSPGIYFDIFGSTWVYPDVVTQDFSSAGELCDNTLNVCNKTAMPVRYQDGGKGDILGVARFSLPTDSDTMLKLHKAFRGYQGLQNKLLTPLVGETLNLTAGLMTSEEAYAEKRNEFTNWADDQIRNGKFQTVLTEITQIVEPEELDAEGKVIKSAVKRVQNVPKIAYADDGLPQRGISPLEDYGILVTGYSIKDWGFEKKTLDQIDAKREANMAIITSRAQAAKANQQRLQAIAEGQRNVATAQYAQEVKKAEQIVIAKREKEVAVIAAQKAVEVNEQNVLAQIQDVLAAREEAQAIELRSTAEADAKKRIMLADGALAQKLETYKAVNAEYAQQFGTQKWVPEMVMGASGDGVDGNAAAEMITLLTAKTAKDLQLDMSMKTN